MAMVGRTKETSAISMRPVRKGKKRRRATTFSAVSAGAPVRLSSRLTSLKLTVPVGNSETEAPPRSTGSSPVTARISALTASRTASAGIRNGRITRTQTPTMAKPRTTNARRLMPTAAVTTRLSQVLADQPADYTEGGRRGKPAAPIEKPCSYSVTLSWPRKELNRRQFPPLQALFTDTKGCWPLHNPLRSCCGSRRASSPVRARSGSFPRPPSCRS